MADHSARQRPRARTERGASAAEYALLIAGIAAVIVTAVIVFGMSVNDLFENTCDSVSQATSDAC